ncbi:MAG: hypothetical protein ACRELF_06915, partial [Gemmataceae bacterium]
MTKQFLALACASLLCGRMQAEEHVGDVFAHGEGISLEQAIPANERGILCLAEDAKGRIYGGTTGRAAHLFVFDPRSNKVRSVARLDGGVGFAYGLVRLPDGSLIGGTQADPTGIAAHTDPKAVGHLYRFTPKDEGPAKVEDLGVAVKKQGIYTLAYVAKTKEIVGNTWPDGHFFTYDLAKRKFTDHGAIAGYRTFETPRHAEDINRGTGQKVRYPRVVSRAIIVHNTHGAFTGGADGFLYCYDFSKRKVQKLQTQLPAAKGREPWASLDAAVVYPRREDRGDDTTFLCGTSDGHLFELYINGLNNPMWSRGLKPLRQGTIQGLLLSPSATLPVYGVGGDKDGMPRSFRFYDNNGGMGRGMYVGGIPHVDGQPSMGGFGAMLIDKSGTIWTGERDRIGRLVRYRPNAKQPKKKKPPHQPAPSSPPVDERPAALPCRIVFAPQGTTTDGSGYTAIEVGKDGKIYVGAARYGDYAWLLRFDPEKKPLFMDKVVSLRQLSGERRRGINTQAKIHAKIVVGGDGRVWFASKQGHEIFDTRPEYGEDADGFPGGHLCYFDPKTGFSRSVGILKKQEGVVAGAIDNRRGKLYYRSEPKNVFLVYDIATDEVRERGHIGASCRYMAMDRDGAVYTVGRGATLCRYDPKTDYVEDLAVKVAGKGGYSPPYVVTIGPNGKLYGLGVSHPWIMEFDIAHVKMGAFPEVTMRNIA